ncbi:PQQ-binding-like beta-propeller repeat protein [Deinococcus petrolearius]|uniref:PQQ-binding-like beta-propeller repeat protein n=1 Tax=Deinococcus petrolearius TaxID=1751295 RepID=A0ABW1DN08_9DEIO
MRTGFLIALMLTVSSCGKSNQEITNLDIPNLPFDWQMPVSGLDVPTFSDGVLINQEVNAAYTKVIGTTAVDTTTRKVLWRDAYDGGGIGDPKKSIMGNTSTIYQGKIVYYNYSQGLVVRDVKTGTIEKRIPLPNDIKELQTNLLDQYFFQTKENMLYFGLSNHLFAYDMNLIIDPGIPAANPTWRIDKEDIGAISYRFSNISLDQSTNQLIYGLTITDSKKRENIAYINLIDAMNGKEIWSRVVHRENDPSRFYFIDGYVLLHEGMAVMTLNGGSSTGFDQASGEQKWATGPFTCPGGETGGMLFVVANGKQFLVMPNGDHCFSSWDIKTGVRKWVFSAPDGHHATFGQQPLVLNGVVYASNSWLWALDAETGKPLGASTYMNYAMLTKGTPLYDAKNNQILVSGGQLTAFRPLR